MRHRNSKLLLPLFLILFLSPLLILFSSPLKVAAGQDTATEPMEGRKVFIKKGCIQCHSIWGVGGKIGPELSRAVQGKTRMQLGTSLWNHSPRMLEKMKELGMQMRPPLSTDEMHQLLSYLFSLNYFDEPGSPVRGKSLFLENRCVTCHSVGGEGGKIGPTWDSLKGLRSPIQMASAMWNHGSKMSAKMASMGIMRPRLAARDLSDLLAFIQSVATLEKTNREYLKPGDPAAGGELFQKKSCIRCHSIRGRGGQVGPDLGRLALWIPAGEFAAHMWNHGERMWAKMGALGVPFPSLSSGEMANILAYLYFTHFDDQPGNPENGKKVFAEKNCVLCHKPGEGSTEIGPNLVTSKAIGAPLDFITGLYNHTEAMEKNIRKTGILPWPIFRENEMNDLFAYLNTLSKRSSQSKKSGK